MPATTTPAQRLARVMRGGTRLVAIHQGRTAIDVTPDVLALVEGVQNATDGFEPGRNLLDRDVPGRDLRTRVHFP